MLFLAEQWRKRENNGHRVDFVQADATQLPFADQSFDAVTGHMFALQGARIFPIATGHEAIQVVPGRIQSCRIDAEEAIGIETSLWQRSAGLGINKRRHTLRVTVVQGLEPGRCHGVVVVIPVSGLVVAQVALVRTVIDQPLSRTGRDVILDRQVINPHLIPNTVLAGVVDDHVLDHLHPLGVSRVDEILIGGIG